MELKRLVMQRPAWLSHSESDEERIVLSAEVALNRNVDSFPFPEKLSLQQKTKLFEQIRLVVSDGSIVGEDPLVINFNDVSDIAKTLLFERDFATLQMFSTPGDRGVIFGDSNMVLKINDENHIALSKFVSNDSVQSAWEELDQADTLLGKQLTYAYDSSIGYLQNRPDQCGTGLTVNYTLHLPGLVQTDSINEVLSGAATMGVIGSGKFHAGNESWGSLFSLSAGVHCGENEKSIIEKSAEVIADIINAEKVARAKIFEEARNEIEDKAWRSYGILKYARMISIPQLLNLTSTIRLAIERGVDIDSMTVATLEGLIATSLQGNVAILIDGVVKESTELDIRRAEIIRSIMEV